MRSLLPFRRVLCTKSMYGILATPLSRPPDGLPDPIFAQSSSGDARGAQITTLPSGLRVASRNPFGSFATLGVIVDAGSRYEADFKSGVSHFAQKLAFQSTSEFPSNDDIRVLLDDHGGIFDCQASRDVIIYGISVENKGVEIAGRILSEVVLKSRLQDFEIEEARMAIRAEDDNRKRSPDQQEKLVEWIHQTAYGSNTLGLPRYCPEAMVSTIGRTDINSYLATYYRPERMTISGVGMPHDQLVKIAEKYFTGNDYTSPLSIDNSVAQYTGGFRQINADLSTISIGPYPLPNLAHCVIALESLPHNHPDFVALCVIQSLLGGGSSFSAGGPGKGMYSRLFTEMLNVYYFCNDAIATNVSYSDSGLFYIHGSCGPPNKLPELIDGLTVQLAHLRTPIDPVELSRAKNQLQSQLLMNSEQKPVAFEDLARQVLDKGTYQSPKEYSELIRSVTEEDIHRVAATLLSSPLTMLGYGDLASLPKLDYVQERILDTSLATKKKRFSIW